MRGLKTIRIKCYHERAQERCRAGDKEWCADHYRFRVFRLGDFTIRFEACRVYYGAARFAVLWSVFYKRSDVIAVLYTKHAAIRFVKRLKVPAALVEDMYGDSYRGLGYDFETGVRRAQRMSDKERTT